MASPPDAPAGLISKIVHEVARVFLSLAKAITVEEHFAAQVSPTAIHDELSRFKMWVGNIAAHRKGRRSLEYRLRDAENLKREVHRVFKDLVAALRNGLAIVKREKTPWDEKEFSDTDLNVSDNDLQEDTELKQIRASITTFVTSLFRLSMAIRDAAPTSQSSKIFTVDKYYFEQHDINHVQTKYPDCAEYLSERLGRAISGRRQYLSYREEHHKKLAKHVEKIGFEEPRNGEIFKIAEQIHIPLTASQHTSNSTEATPMPQLDRQNSIKILDEDDGASQTSFAPSVNAAIRVPALSREARENEFSTIVGTNGSNMSWKHIGHSGNALNLAEKVFSVQQDFEEHIRKTHADLQGMLSAMKRTSAKFAELTENVSCPLYKKGMSLRGLHKHLASHQQQLALFALPPNLDETEEEEVEDDQERSSREVDTEDISDIRESDNPDAVDEPLAGGCSSSPEQVEPARALFVEKGTTRMPKSIVMKVAVVALAYPFEEEVSIYVQVHRAFQLTTAQDGFIVITRALEPEHIDELVEVSGNYKQSHDAEINNSNNDDSEHEREQRLHLEKISDESPPMTDVGDYDQREDRETPEAAMRKRLTDFGFVETMIQQGELEDGNTNLVADAMSAVGPPLNEPADQKTLPADNPPAPLTNPKIHRDHLDLETLHYYDIAYEIDETDPNYFVVLRELSNRETEVLFEHTRRLRGQKRVENFPEYKSYKSTGETREEERLDEPAEMSGGEDPHVTKTRSISNEEFARLVHAHRTRLNETTPTADAVGPAGDEEARSLESIAEGREPGISVILEVEELTDAANGMLNAADSPAMPRTELDTAAILRQGLLSAEQTYTVTDLEDQVRTLWPIMHQQQAALARARAQAQSQATSSGVAVPEPDVESHDDVSYGYGPNEVSNESRTGTQAFHTAPWSESDRYSSKGIKVIHRYSCGHQLTEIASSATAKHHDYQDNLPYKTRTVRHDDMCEDCDLYLEWIQEHRNEESKQMDMIAEKRSSSQDATGFDIRSNHSQVTRFREGKEPPIKLHFSAGSHPKYPKGHRQYLDEQTMAFYNMPYERDVDPNYFIWLQKCDQKQMDVMFEHTRRLRSESASKEESMSNKDKVRLGGLRDSEMAERLAKLRKKA
ncbi:hypothetical protein EK21DRAFT_93852 [Setomelanomma holmii]|uniref:Uncharacterized protein n=1 Tax=Setomelanomma holmii TaxID=210430 RepID=A0A9P4GZB6_9PLEO|nr:hypothetical protein EK21DRAFT_93852 [Setomelanomma holmii]